MVERDDIPADSVHLSPAAARHHVGALFSKMGVPEPSADLIAEVLVSADMKGIRSHGLARVPYFLLRLERGVMDPNPAMEFRRGSATTGLLDARNGVGIVAADRGLREALAMADRYGCGFVVVKDSSHFGYAGFWSERAMRSGFIGISMSNSGRRVAPTYGTDAILGTNPVSVAIPGGDDDFLLDMASSAVAVGKVETALREGRAVPSGWVVDPERVRLDRDGVLTFDTPLVPLGGQGTGSGGHKGYGLGLMIELLCGALGGTSFLDRLAGAGGEAPAAMGHLLGALKVDSFRDPDAMQSDMDALFERIRGSTKAPGEDRIYIHGEPERHSYAKAVREGVSVASTVIGQLDRWARRLDVPSLVS